MIPSILDAHIHLWPENAANASSHSWMTPNSHLAKQYSPEDYLKATAPRAQDLDVEGFIYVETDRIVGNDYEHDDEHCTVAEPLNEIAYLRRLNSGTPDGNEGFDASHAEMLKGIVAWAPFDRPLHSFLRYLSRAKEVAGEQTWDKVKGFRFLLQGIKDEDAFRKLIDPTSSSFVLLLKFLGSRNLSFDVGVDQRQGGVWQLEHFAKTIEQTHENVQTRDKTVFILNHLCKPDMEQEVNATEQTQVDFDRWKTAVTRMAKQEKVYMKLSGAFSEIADQDSQNPFPVEDIVKRTSPWLDHIFVEFSPWRIMFGSDWPVCNVRGPGDKKSWSLWVDVVAEVMRVRDLSAVEKDRIWRGTAIEAYRLGLHS
jgi:L-rhamnono-1,4-lactonase